MKTIVTIIDVFDTIQTSFCRFRQVTEEDIAFCMGELENPLPEVDQEEHPLRVLSQENMTVVSTFTGMSTTCSLCFKKFIVFFFLRLYSKYNYGLTCPCFSPQTRCRSPMISKECFRDPAVIRSGSSTTTDFGPRRNTNKNRPKVFPNVKSPFNSLVEPYVFKVLCTSVVYVVM